MPEETPATETTPQLAALVASFPGPGTGGKLTGADKSAMDAAVRKIHAMGAKGIAGLVAMLVSPVEGGDSKVRHALHALMIFAGGLEDGQRQEVATALAATLDGESPVEVKEFVIRQLQLIGGNESTPVLGKLLLDGKLYDEAAQALLVIGDGAAEQFRAALPRATGVALLAVVHGLGELRDSGSAAPELRRLLSHEDTELRLTAAWALANSGDVESADLILEAAETKETYQRNKFAHACLLLAERLSASGESAKARRIYEVLRDSRLDAAERFVREAAERGLAKLK